MIYVTKPELPPIWEQVLDIVNINRSKILTNDGPYLKKFKKSLSTNYKTENISVVSNGTVALTSILKTFSKGGEIITSPFTFAATSAAIVDSGLIPVYADIDDDLVLDPNKIEELITPNTVAVLPTQTYGFLGNYNLTKEICNKHKLKLIYDAAHSMGVKTKGGKPIISLGDFTATSFHATKVLNSLEGGCIYFKDTELSKYFQFSRNFGINGSADISVVGLNHKITEFNCAVGWRNMKRLEFCITKRKKIAKLYDALLANTNLQFPRDNKIIWNYAYYPILCRSYEDRRKIIIQLNDGGIVPRKYFAPLLTNTMAYSNYASGYINKGQDIANRILCLPIYPRLALKNVHKISYIIRNTI